MIPKIIHYCWLSNDPFPDKIQKCINSWREKLPDYKLVRWDLERCKSIDSKWIVEAYNQKRYAFAADFIRFYVLFNYGGIYLDSDVEVLKSFDDFLHLPYFIGFDSFGYFEAAVIGSEANVPWISKCLNYYADRHFLLENGQMDTSPLPGIMYNLISENYNITPITKEHFNYLQDANLYVYPYNYFSPKRHDTGKINVKTYTYTIHHYAMSWIPNRVQRLVQIKRRLMLLFGSNFINFLIKVFALKKMKDWILRH